MGRGGRAHVGVLLAKAFEPGGTVRGTALGLLMNSSRAWATEVENISIDVLYFESTQAVIGVLNWLEEFDVARCEFFRQSVWIGNVEVSVPTCLSALGATHVVRERIDVNVFEHDHRGAPLNNAKENVIGVWSLIRDIEPQLVAIERQRCENIPHDEERGDAGDICFIHLRRRVIVNQRDYCFLNLCVPLRLRIPRIV